MSEETKEKSALVPRLRFPEFQEAGEWEQKPLTDVASLKNGYAFKSNDYVDVGPYQIITIANVQSGSLVIESTNKISALPSDIQQHQVLCLGDILISMTGNVGRVCRVTTEGLLLNQRVGKLIPDKISQEFFYQSLQRDQFRNTMQLKAAGGAQGNLSASDIAEYGFSLPLDQREQQKIADCLFSLDELITAETQKLDALKTHKKGLMQQLFPREGETVPRLRFPEFREAGEWREKTLEAVCEMQAGKFVAASEISETQADGLFPCFGGNGLRGYTKTYNQSGRYSLIGRQGALCGNVNLVDGDFYATEHAVVTTPKASISTDWLFYNLCLLNLNRFATGQAQPGLSVEVLGKVACVVPRDKDEQQKIAGCLSSLDDLITAQSQKIDALKIHKKGLMQQLFPVLDEASA